MSRPGGSVGAEIRSVKYGDRFQPAVVFTCAGCGTERAERFPNFNVSPQHAAKRARRDGWIAEPDQAGANHCPACILARRAKAAGDKPEPKKETTDVTTTVTSMQKPAAALPRDPTQQERVKIRGMLDQHFDDATGCYLDGWSDQRIGADLNVPWAIVAKIREAAYGPIKVDPELAGLRAEATGLGTKIEALMKEQYALIERINAYSKKRGAA